MTVTLFTVQTPGEKTVWNIREILQSEIKWTTDINFACGQLTFKCVEVNEGFTPKNGDIVSFKWDDKPVFKGKIFKFDYDESEVFSITAYDSLRYFKNQDSLVWPVGTIAQRFTQVCKLAGVKGKVVNNSTHKLKAEVCDSKSYFDMLKDSFKSTQSATDHKYFLFDNFGTIELRRSPFKKMPYYVGDKSNLQKFSYSRSIDDAVNTVRVVRTDKTKKQQTSATAKTKTKAPKNYAGSTDPKSVKLTKVTASSSTVARWGRLQTVEKAKDKANTAQMKQKAKDILKSKGKQAHTLKLTTFASLNMVPGNYWPVKIGSLNDIGIGARYTLITKATHTFTATTDTAELEMKARF